MTANTIIIIHRTDTIQLSLFIGNLPSWLQPSGPGGLFSPGQHPTTLLHVMRTEFYNIPTLIVCGYSAPLFLFIIFLCFWYTYVCTLSSCWSFMYEFAVPKCSHLWYVLGPRGPLPRTSPPVPKISITYIYIWAYMPSKSWKDPSNLAVGPLWPCRGILVRLVMCVMVGHRKLKIEIIKLLTILC